MALRLFQSKRLTVLSLKNVIRSLSSESKPRKSWCVSREESPGVISSPINIEPTYKQTIPEFLWQNLHKWENAPAFECAVTGRKYTFKELHSKSKSFAASLKQHGLKRTESVCILLPNMPEYPIAALGIWDAGLVAAPINPGYTVDEVVRQINDCGGKVIITIPQLLPTVESAKERCPTLKSIIVIGEDTQGYHSFFDMLKTDASSFKFLKGSDINSMKETAVLPYSSGTTGPPKGVELTHSTFTTNLLQITYPGYRLTNFFEKGTKQEKIIAVMPFFHMYGLQIIMACAIYQGAHTLCLPRFEPEMYIKAVKQHKPTVLHLVTPLMTWLINCDQITAEDLKDTRGTVAGAAPIGPQLIDRYLNKFDHYTLFQEGFGMTEISSVSHLIPPEIKNSMKGSSGVLVPGTSMKIIGVESGNVLGPNEPGEICVSGPQIMKGYYKNEMATNETLGIDGFLRTGDIGCYNEEGFLYIVDRIKELIKVSGYQVAPAELESVMRTHPKIADIAIIGVPNKKTGEAPRAYVVPKDKSLTEESVKSFLDGKVSEYKKLFGGVEFIDVIPKAPSGKILRRELKADYLSKHTK